MPPPVPVAATLNVPVAAVLLAARVRGELPLPGAAIDVGLKLAVTPEGAPETVNATAALKPPTAALDIVALPEVPCATDKLVGEALNTKSAAWFTVIVREITAVWVMPPPVAVTVTLEVPVVAA